MPSQLSVSGGRLDAGCSSHALLPGIALGCRQRICNAPGHAPGPAPQAPKFEAMDLESCSGRYNTVTCLDVMIHYPQVRGGGWGWGRGVVRWGCTGCFMEVQLAPNLLLRQRSKMEGSGCEGRGRTAPPAHFWPPAVSFLQPKGFRSTSLVASCTPHPSARAAPPGQGGRHDQPPGIACGGPAHHFLCAQDAGLLDPEAHWRALPGPVQGGLGAQAGGLV